MKRVIALLIKPVRNEVADAVMAPPPGTPAP